MPDKHSINSAKYNIILLILVDDAIKLLSI